METSLISHSLSDGAQLLGEDPWDECINRHEPQSGCVNLEAGTIQPPIYSACKTTNECYRYLRSIWAQGICPNPRILKNPFGKTHQPSQTICFLLAQKWNFLTPPLAPAAYTSGAAAIDTGPLWKPGSLPELCQLALLWAIAGKKGEASNLARWLLPFIQDKPLISFWSLQEEYEEEESLLSFSLLLRAAGQKEKAAELFKQTRKSIDPFFIALAKQAPLFNDLFSSAEMIHDLDLGLTLSRKKKMTSALVLSGLGTSLGVVTSGDVEIRAMGPHALPLSDPTLFGISRAPDGSFITDWTRCFALSEVWFEVKSVFEESSLQLDLRFIGIRTERPLTFVFYLKANSCSIGQTILKPKSLQRYSGEAQAFLFEGTRSKLRIESALSHKVQVIPLAGEGGGFWNTDFLLSFEIHPFESQAKFNIRIV